ncbi:MAG: phage holin family protein [Myxococcales bacterium]|nr:phage holin family protein [Myxococcota bacterium]MDW8282804.1 phage holin family protein [Myxococcales bacterium]
MVTFLLSSVLYALSVMVAARVVPGLHVRSFGGALKFALVLGVLDAVLFKALALLTLPVVILTFGLFLLVIRAFLFWLADKLVAGVQVDNFLAAFLGSLLSGAIGFVLRHLLGL